MTALTEILDTFRTTSHSEREKGAYFENLVKVYLKNEPVYKDLLMRDSDLYAGMKMSCILLDPKLYSKVLLGPRFTEWILQCTATPGLFKTTCQNSNILG